jgi:hypothetical protein
MSEAGKHCIGELEMLTLFSLAFWWDIEKLMFSMENLLVQETPQMNACVPSCGDVIHLFKVTTWCTNQYSISHLK